MIISCYNNNSNHHYHNNVQVIQIQICHFLVISLLKIWNFLGVPLTEHPAEKVVFLLVIKYVI